MDLLGGHQSWCLAPSMDKVGYFRPFSFGKDGAEHVLNVLFEEVDVALFVGIGCMKDLLPIHLVGTLKMEAKLGK
jgi:hypothetical protein